MRIMTKTSARLTMLSRLTWAFLGCAGVCLVVAMVSAMNTPSAGTCQTIQRINGQLGNPTVPTGCGPQPWTAIGAGGIALFVVLAIAVRIAASWQSAKITDLEGRPAAPARPAVGPRYVLTRTLGTGTNRPTIEAGTLVTVLTVDQDTRSASVRADDGRTALALVTDLAELTA
jgi:hypothetical protein